MDRLKYARLWPRYISGKKALMQEDPDVWESLESGNFAVTETATPFVSKVQTMYVSMSISG